MAGRTYAYYPGCALHGTAREYDVSARLVCQTLNVKLQEIKDWSCCGASSAASLSPLLGIALPAHNLKLAAAMELPITTPCAMCSYRLKTAAHELKDEATARQVSEVLGSAVGPEVTVEPLLQVLSEDLSFPIRKPLTGLKVACYYGCLLVRPKSVLQFDDEENPQTMDRLITALGAEAIDWGLKTECCGAGLPLARPDLVHRLAYRIISLAQRLGADCIATACPMCQSNLDIHQKEIEAEHGEKLGLPIFYFTQLLGLALGFTPRELYLHKHLTNPLPLLRAKGLG
ncbi:MAG: CoB--CoM heterodisulfide reductase iron-sulfur subunit B family protein [Chloroflexi bacterium]|nr:CoB--CoM heterodisulfide reductase iron-sulfur subunit B family protein [Chloroflexota bacterium]